MEKLGESLRAADGQVTTAGSLFSAALGISKVAGENEGLMSNTFYGSQLFTASLKIEKKINRDVKNQELSSNKS